MQILTLSDIHGNLAAVRKLRSQEQNNFDAVIIAGDIGASIIDPFIALISTFNCPIYYVYGNWDSSLRYDDNILPGCHLHLRIEKIGNYFITGFSGCTVNWGRNPIALELYANLELENRSIISKHDEVSENYRQKVKEFEAKYQIKLEQIKQEKAMRNKSYKKKWLDLHKKRKKFTDTAFRDVEQFSKSQEYIEYKRKRAQTSKVVEKRCRERMFELIRSAAVPASGLIVTTHERQYKLQDDLSSLKFHLYGHRHGFKHTVYRGTNFVNVSALDYVRTVAAAEDGDPVEIELYRRSASGANLKNVNLGTYGIIQIFSNSDISVVKRSLNVPSGRWIITDFVIANAPWIKEEEKFCE